MEMNPRELFDSCEEAILMSNVEGRIVFANLAAVQLYGYTREELLGMNVKSLWHGAGRASSRQHLELIEQHGLRFIAVHRNRKGSQLNVTMQSRRLKLGGRQHVVSIITQNPAADGVPAPLSEQVKTAAGYALVQSKRVDEIASAFSMISQFATAGMLLLDSDCTILGANNSLCALLGYARQDLVGNQLLFLFANEQIDAGMELFTALISGRISSYEEERRCVTSAGEAIWTRITATALVSGNDRHLLCVYQIEDISAEKRHREELRHYAALVHHSDVAILSVDLAGMVRSWNPAAERTLGYAEREVAGRHLGMLIPDCEALTIPYLEQAMAGNPLQAETIWRRQDGRMVNVSLNLSPIRNEKDRIIGVSALVRDVTEMKHLQAEIAQLDRLNLVGCIAASFGHEVRNPMTTVRGYLQLMLRRPELQSLQPQMYLMIEEMDRVNGIISEFLSLARNKPTERALHDISDEVRVMMPLMEAEAALRGNEIVLHLEVLPAVSIDPKEIRQLLLNLVRNGFEAMGQGGRLTIRTYLQDGEVVLEVADQGPGIPEELQPKLGMAFFTTKESGTGLGLLTCYSIAAKHRAKINLETNSDGSIFRVHFQPPAQF